MARVRRRSSGGHPFLLLFALLISTSSIFYFYSHPGSIHWELGLSHLPNAENEGLVAGPTGTGQAQAAAMSSAKGSNEPQASELARKHVLTKQLAQSVAGRHGYVVVTWANWHYREFVQNWVDHLRAVGCHSFIVGAMDDELLQYLLDRQVPTFSMSSGLTTGDLGWGSAAFHAMGREKINLIHAFTSMGISTIISDVDTVWMRDPVPYMEQYPVADVLHSSDCLANSVEDEGLEKEVCWWHAANIGILMFRPSAINLTEAWVAGLDADPKVWDQTEFNDLRRSGELVPVEGLAAPQDRLYWAYNRTLRMGVLPIALFANGHTYFVQRTAEKLGLRPYVVHAVFQYSGTPGKLNRLREAMLWNDPDEYFQRPGGYLAIEPDLPQRLLDAAAAVHANRTWGTKPIPIEQTLPHFQLVHHQLAQIRTLFALATILGRAAVLPPMWVGLDRWWAPHAGEIPGSNHVDLPFLAPADHVLDLEWMDHVPDMDPAREEEQYGPHIEWRAYTFLKQPQAASIAATAATVVICQDANDASCADGSAPAEVKEGVVRLRPWLDEAQLATALESVKDYKLVRVEGVAGALKGFSDATKAQQFERRAQRSASIWCCSRPPGESMRGHVWYDFYADQVPHTDRFGRAFHKPWDPRFGP